MSDNVSYNERELLLKIAEGDERAFEELYLQYDDMLYSFLIKLTKLEHIAEEIIQETFLRLWLNRDKLSDVEHPRAYIHRMAANISANWMKQHFLSNRKIQRYQYQQMNLDADTTSTETGFAIKELSALVTKIIADMPEQRRIIYTLHRDSGLKSHEIAARLNISASTVRNTIASAVKLIREQLQKEGYLVPALLIFIGK